MGKDVTSDKPTSENQHQRRRLGGSGSRYGWKTVALILGVVFAPFAVNVTTGVTVTTGAVRLAIGDSKTVKPDFSYFTGKTITLVEPGGLGGTTYEDAAVAAPLMASYLHATINVEVISTGAGITGQDQAAAAPPNGLTIGEMLPQADLIDDIINTPNIDFSLQKVEFIGSPLPPATDMFVAPNSGLHNLNEVLHSNTKIPFLDLTQRGLSDLETRVVLGAYNANVRIVTGYSSSANLVSGFLRGDGPAMVTSFTAAESDVAAGLAIPVLQGTAPEKGTALYSTMRKVPTVAEYLASHKPSTPAGRAAMKEMLAMVQSQFVSFYVPEGTPKPYVLALTDAFRSAMAQPSAHQELLTAGLDPGYISPETSLANIKTQVKHASIIARFLNYGNA